jgi:hypothetical protein
MHSSGLGQSRSGDLGRSPPSHDLLKHLQNDQTIYEFFKGPSKVSDQAEVIEVTFSVGHRRNASLGGDLLRSVRRLSGRADVGELAPEKLLFTSR